MTTRFDIEDLQSLLPTCQLEGLIAEGRGGAIYLAHQPALDRPVALRILPLDGGAGEIHREALTTGAKAMARLKHPNLIGVYDFGELDGMLFIVMEYVDGGPLRNAAGRDPVDPVKAIELVTAICEGLAHAHESGVVHLDLNPSNILLDANLQPKIGNFGSGIHDTPGYVAPEVLAGQPGDQRSDVFSVGVLLHRILTGREPTRFPLPPASSLCGTPLVIDTIIAKATHRNPDKRFSGADQLAANLHQATRAVPATSAPRGHVTATRPAAPAPSSTTAPDRRKFPTQIAIATIALAIVAGTMAVVTRGDDDDRDQTPGDPLVQIAPRDPAAKELSAPATPAVREKTHESIHDALARLRNRLAAGLREEFPQGTVARNNSHFLVIDEAMSWHEAEQMAEQHGAHLAVLPDPSDRTWLREQFEISQPLWLGAGKTAHDRWSWIDGSPWSSEDEVPTISERNRRLAFSPSGGLFPNPPAQKYAPVLQWRTDGSNPGTAEAQLQRLEKSARSQDAGTLEFPIDTRTFGESHFLYRDASISWDEARKYAESVGAQLAAPSSLEEHQWICETFAPGLGKGQALWLGGFRKEPGERWQWLTKEAWNNAGWQSEQPAITPDLDRLLLRGAAEQEARGWAVVAGTAQVATGFLLEWSDPPESAPVAAFNSQQWLSGVNRKIGSLVGTDLEEFEKSRGELVQDYSRAMNRILRKEEKDSGWGNRFPGRGGQGGFRWPGDRRSMLEGITERLKESTKSNELLAGLPEDSPEKLIEQQKKSEAALTALEGTYDAKLRKHLAFYRNGIGKKSNDLAAKGYLETARDLTDLTAPLEDNLPAFLQVLYKEDSPRATLPWQVASDDGALTEKDLLNDPPAR